ncbi:hypothetical protein VN96_1502 [Lactococcus cremoris]|nr:hypothetical protein VN96_1502 [Lactococcus cremoris]
MEYDLFSEPNKEFPEVNPFMYAPMIIINTTKKTKVEFYILKIFLKKSMHLSSITSFPCKISSFVYYLIFFITTTSDVHPKS